MLRALYSAASGMTAQQMNVDNIANNLANANTTGYKTRQAQFTDLLYQTMVQPGSASGQQTTVPTGLQVGLGTRAASNEIIFTQAAAQQAGQIQLATFVNPAGLNSIGGNLYMPTDASGTATVGAPGGAEGSGTIMQGYTEQSNVSVVEEFVNLIVAQRGYEANSKVVKAADEMYQQVNQIVQ